MFSCFYLVGATPKSMTAIDEDDDGDDDDDDAIVYYSA